MAWTVALLWLGLVLASAWLERGAGVGIETCLFLRVTGHPCPTCGSTRAFLALLHGAVGPAFRLNPLFTAALPGLLLLAGLRLGFGRRLRLDLGATGRRLLLAAWIAALLGNWAWVLGRG